MVKLWLDWLIFGDDPVWRHNQLMTSTRNARKIWPKNGGADTDCCFGSRLILPVFVTVLLQPWQTFERCLNIVADRGKCGLQTRFAIFFLFALFFAGRHLPIQWPNHPLLTPNSPSPGVLAPKNSNSEKGESSKRKQSNLGLCPRSA